MVRLRDWRQLIAQLRGSDYVANVTRLSVGATLAQAIGILAAPIITRLYQPHQYGLAASYAAIVGVIGAIAALRYDFAIVLPDNDEEATSAVWLCVSLVTIASLLTAVLLLVAWVVSPQVVVQPFGLVILLLPVSIFVTTASVILTNWANRKRQYTVLARSRVLAAAVTPAVAVGTFLFLGSTVLGLVLASLDGAATGVLLLLWVMTNQQLLPGRRSVSLGQLKFAARRYRQFPLYNLWMTLLDQLTSSLPVLLFAGLFSPAVAAYFALANNVLRLPMSLVGQAVAQVFYERAARQQHLPTQLRHLVLVNIKGLALLAVLPLLIVVALGPTLFAFVFGPSWQQAGLFARFLVVATTLTFVASPISMMPSVLNQQHVHLVISLIAVVARVASIWLGVQAGSPMLAVAFYSLGEGAVIVVFLAWLLNYLHRLEQRVVDQSSSALH